MLILNTSKYRKRRSHVTEPPPLGPLLVSAVYNEGFSELMLVFDRAVDTSAFCGSAIKLEDGLTHHKFYVGTETVPVNPTTMRIGLVENGESGGTKLLLT